MTTPTATAAADQALAAERDAARLFGRIADTLGSQQRTDPPLWAQQQLATLLRSLAGGTADLCPHIRLDAPQPMIAVAHRPGEVMCLPCYGRAGRATRASAEDNTCDVCRQHTPAGVSPALVRFGCLILTWGCCSGCQPTGIGATA